MIKKEKATITVAPQTDNKDTKNLSNKPTFDLNFINDKSYLHEITDTKPNADTELLERLKKCKISIDENYIEPEPLLTMQGEYEPRTTVFSRGNISVISGKAKSRKTFCNTLLAQMYLQQSNGKILYLDTEQSKSHVQRIQQRIYSLMGWGEFQTNERFLIYFLREFATKDRAQAVEILIEKHRPDLVFLDGVRDIVCDFNSPTESAECVDMIMRLSSEFNNHICSVLHENKGANAELRGHLGTELQNKAETVITVSKDLETSKVVPRFCRNTDFKAFSFSIEQGLPKRCEMLVQTTATNKLIGLFDTIFSNGLKTLSHSELVQKICQIKGVSISTAKTNISKAISDGILKKSTTGAYILNSSNEREDSDILF